jgi:hypothetical protein
MDGAFDAALEPGMTVGVEALVSPEGGDFSIKREDQVLITETGCENLTEYPFDPALMGQSQFGSTYCPTVRSPPEPVKRTCSPCAWMS